MDGDLAMLGLNEYESRLYRALLAEHPATAYRLGKLSGVPLSRVYEVADRLVEKGAAQRLDGNPARYEPINPEILVGGAHARMARKIESLATELTALYTGNGSEGSIWLHGEELVISHLDGLIRQARRGVDIASGDRGLEKLEEMTTVKSADVRIRILAYVGSELSPQDFIALIDGERAVMGRMGPSAEALSTGHPSILHLCADYFRQRSVADAAQTMMGANRTSHSTFDKPAGWLDWEEQKRRRLLHAQ